MVKTTPKIDLRPDHLAIVQAILHRHLPKTEVWAYGSRVAWTSEEYSDLDLVARASQDLAAGSIEDAKEAFINSTLPFRVELFEWDNLPAVFQTEILKGYAVMQRGGCVMEGWRETTLGNFCPFLYGKGLPERDRKVGKIPVVSSAGITGMHNEAFVFTAGIAIGRKGTVGKLTFLKNSFWPIDTAFYIPDAPEHRDLRFTFYLLQTLDLHKMNSDSAVPGLNRNNAHQKKIIAPPLAEQRAIAAVLGALDDKIELNNRMNATLEATAQALFKSWFVDFDPVKAKMSGNAPFGMDAATAALFPNRLIDSELGAIPEGWAVSSVGKEFDITMGQSPPGETYNETGEGLPFYQGRTDFGFRFPTPRIHCTQPNRVAKAGDTLISVRAPVGDINMAHGKCILGRGVGALRHKSKARGYTYYAVKSIQGSLKAFEADGTVFGSVSKQDLEKVKFLQVPLKLAEKFELEISVFDDKILLLTDENKSLECIRDYLLPKLISGNIRIPDAEKFVEGLG